jgi:hypothetical protein
MTHRTLELATTLGSPTTELFGFVAAWRGIKGDAVENLAYASLGIEAAPTPDHPSTTKCWYELCGASPLNDAGTEAVRDAYRHMRRAVDAIDDIEHRWMDLVNLIDAGLEDDPEIGVVRQRLDQLAGRLGSPRLTGFSLLFEGHSHLLMHAPEAAWSTYSRLREAAHGATDGRMESMAMRSLALVAVLMQRADALERCREALEMLYDTRYWQKLWQTMDSTALALANAGRDEEAATVLGHLDAHMPACGWEDTLRFRDLARDAVRSDAPATAFTAGARMSADEIVLAAIEWCSE